MKHQYKNMRSGLSSNSKMFNSGVVIFAVVGLALCATPTKKPRPTPDGRIVGGDDANIEDYPYQLSLLYDGDHTCGASILSAKWALTAAHCTDGIPATTFTVRAGSSLLGTGGQVIKVKNIFQHPGFDFSDMDFDIAVLELAEDIKFNKRAAPIQLVKSHARIAAGSEAVVTGWGLLDQDFQLLPSHLQVVKVPIISNEQCTKAYGSQLTDRMICAGFTEGGKDSCQGDSGGPFVVGGKQVGIVSWGYGCAEPKYPGVYTNVAALRDFVADITKI